MFGYNTAGNTLTIIDMTDHASPEILGRQTYAAAGYTHQVRKTPSLPRSWANFSLLWLHPHRTAWANLHLLDQPSAFLVPGLAERGPDPPLPGRRGG